MMRAVVPNSSPYRLSHTPRALVAALASAALAAVLGGCATASVRSSGARKPNVVFILADDLGRGEIGVYGQKLIKTPHIDRLAAQGMRFSQHYSGNAVCAPSRCSLLTGKHPGRAYVRDNNDPPERRGQKFPGQTPIPGSEITIAEMMKAAGYATGAMGKWGLGYEGSSGDPTRQGFDLFYGHLCQRHAHFHWPEFLWRNGVKEPLSGNEPKAVTSKIYSQDRFTEEAMAFIRGHRDRPFFLFLPFIIPHVSIQVPDESLADYRDKFPEGPPYEDKGHYTKHPTPRAAYAAMVSHMDRAVGRIMAHLAQLGLEDDTIVFFSSDNGPTGGRVGGADSVFFGSAAGLRGFKGSLYEGGIRTPMIVRWPGKIAAGSTSDHASAFWDVMVTIADLAGVAAPEGTDGISFAPTLLGRPQTQRKHDYLYWEFPGYGGQQAVRMGDWKAVRQKMQDKSNPDPLRIELYDLANDPGEQHDVAAAHPDVVARAVTLMKGARVPSALFPLGPLDAAGELRQATQRGYGGKAGAEAGQRW